MNVTSKMSTAITLAGAILCFFAGCGNDNADSANEDGLRFVIYGLADGSEYESEVRVFNQEDKMVLDSTAEFECKTGSLDLEQVRVAAFCQCLGKLAEFLCSEYRIDQDEDDDSANITRASTSGRIGNFYIDKRVVNMEEEHRTRLRSTTKISDGGDLSVVIRTTHVYDERKDEVSFESDVDIPLGFTVEEFQGLLSNSGVSIDIMYEQAGFDGFPMNSSARFSSDSKDVVSSVRQLLAKNGGNCRYMVRIHFRQKGN